MRYLFVILLLAGCGSGDESGVSADNHGYGFQFDVQDGLKLRGSTDVAFYQDAFAKTQKCTGLSAPPPFVIVDKLAGNAGEYFSDPSLILVDVDHTYAVKHEMVHYLLDVNTGDSDGTHASHFFADCV